MKTSKNEKKCENCGSERPGIARRFCSRKCLGIFYGSLNKGKKYKRHKKNYHGNQTSFKKGVRPNPETEFKRGIRPSIKTEFKIGQTPWNTGLKMSNSTRAKQSMRKVGVYLGNKNPNWQGGKTPYLMRLRGQLKYFLWRKMVFERDNYTCQDCEVRGLYIHAHHIKPFAFFPEERLSLSNGRTLCIPCHRKTPTYGSKCKKAVIG